MRLVSHPNVVDLKAFFYSNGDKVCVTTSFPMPGAEVFSLKP